MNKLQITSKVNKILYFKARNVASLLLLGSLALLLPVAVGAQQSGLVQCGISAPIDPSQCTLDDLLDVPVRIYNFLLGLAGIVALAVIVWGGAKMLLFYVSESPEQELNNAKLTLSRGIFGLVIIATAYLIVNLLLYTFLQLNPSSGVGRILEGFGI